MKAIVVTDFGGPEKMRYVDLEKPTIRPNQLLIRVQTTSVNFADIKSRYSYTKNLLPYSPQIFHMTL